MQENNNQEQDNSDTIKTKIAFELSRINQIKEELQKQKSQNNQNNANLHDTQISKLNELSQKLQSASANLDTTKDIVACAVTLMDSVKEIETIEKDRVEQQAKAMQAKEDLQQQQKESQERSLLPQRITTDPKQFNLIQILQEALAEQIKELYKGKDIEKDEIFEIDQTMQDTLSKNLQEKLEKEIKSKLGNNIIQDLKIDLSKITKDFIINNNQDIRIGNTNIKIKLNPVNKETVQNTQNYLAGIAAKIGSASLIPPKPYTQEEGRKKE